MLIFKTQPNRKKTPKNNLGKIISSLKCIVMKTKESKKLMFTKKKNLFEQNNSKVIALSLQVFFIQLIIYTLQKVRSKRNGWLMQ